MKSWRELLVSSEINLENAILALDEGGARIVLVTDHNGRLLGTVTDGDIRRALLKYPTLSTPIRLVMCESPVVAKIDWTREKVLGLMEERQLLHVPVINDFDQVIGLHLYQELIDRKKRIDNPVFLMAGGFGTRLHPLTIDCPKPLLKVGGKPILERILEGFIESGFHKFFISTHYLPEMIKNYFGDGARWGVTISYIHEDSPLGTGGALGLLPHDEIDQPLILMNGDVLTNLNHIDLLNFHKSHSGVATMCVRNYEYQVPYGVIQSDGYRIKTMIEKPLQKFFVNAGIYVLSPNLVWSVKPSTRVDMPTILEAQIAAGVDVMMFPIHEYWVDIGRPPDYERANIDVNFE